MGTVCDFTASADARRAAKANKEDIIRGLTVSAPFLRQRMESAFGVKMIMEGELSFSASFPHDLLDILTPQNEDGFAIAPCGQRNEALAIAAVYYRVTHGLMRGESIRRKSANGEYTLYGYDKVHDRFHVIEQEAPLVQALPFGRAAHPA